MFVELLFAVASVEQAGIESVDHYHKQRENRRISLAPLSDLLVVVLVFTRLRLFIVSIGLIRL